MIRKLLKLANTQTAIDATYMTVATGVSAVIAAIFFILVARLTGPETLGLFSLATAASFMFADIFDIAINNTLIRHVAKELERNEQKASQFLKFTLKFKLVIGVAIVIVVTSFAGMLSKLLFGNSLPFIMMLVGIGTALHLLYTFTISHLQARKQFLKAAFGIILIPILRLTGLALVVAYKMLRLTSILSAYFFSLPVAAAMLIMSSSRTFLKVKNENMIAKQFLRYNIPLTAGFALASIGGRIDNFILANLADPKSVGFYAAAFRLFTPIQFLAGSLSTVFAPRFAGFESSQKAKKYFTKSLVGITLLSIVLLLAIPFSSFIVNLFYGSAYIPSIPVLQILFFGFAALMLQAPFSSLILYFFSKPKVFTFVSLIQLIFIITADSILIPKFQEIGASIAFVITQGVVLLIFATYVFREFQKSDRQVRI